MELRIVHDLCYDADFGKRCAFEIQIDARGIDESKKQRLPPLIKKIDCEIGKMLSDRKVSSTDAEIRYNPCDNVLDRSIAGTDEMQHITRKHGCITRHLEYMNGALPYDGFKIDIHAKYICVPQEQGIIDSMMKIKKIIEKNIIEHLAESTELFNDNQNLD